MLRVAYVLRSTEIPPGSFGLLVPRLIKAWVEWILTLLFVSFLVGGQNSCVT